MSMSAKHAELHQPFDAVRRGGDAEALGAGQALGCRVDPYHRTHFEVLAIAHDLDHQVGTDIARADDGRNLVRITVIRTPQNMADAADLAL